MQYIREADHLTFLLACHTVGPPSPHSVIYRFHGSVHTTQPTLWINQRDRCIEVYLIAPPSV
jgi:hypothetical protein